MVGYDSILSLFEYFGEKLTFLCSPNSNIFRGLSKECERWWSRSWNLSSGCVKFLGKLQIVCLQTASECTVQLRDINDDGCLMAWKSITITWYRISLWHQSCIWVVWSMSQFVCVFALQVDVEEKPRVDPRTVLSIILGGGAGTRLFPLTKRRAKPAVRATPFM